MGVGLMIGMMFAFEILGFELEAGRGVLRVGDSVGG